MDVTHALDAAVRAADKAIADEMQTLDGRPAEPHLERLRDTLLAMRDRGTVGPEELRTVIRDVATWAPEDNVSLLSALGAIAKVGGAGRRAEE